MTYIAKQDRYEKMEYRFCGRSGLKLPAMSVGLWHNFGYGSNYENAKDIILTSFDTGITHFDLANNYGPPAGSAEEMFGKILHTELEGYRDELVISTKAGYGMWGSALRDNSAVYSSPVIYHTDYVGAGAGFYLNNYFYIDLAYQYRNDKLTDYTTFYCYNDTEDFASPTYRTSIQRHSVILTLGFRF